LAGRKRLQATIVPAGLEAPQKEEQSVRRLTMGLTGICTFGFLAALAAACSHPCDALKDQCKSCANATNQAFCNIVVAADDKDACQSALDSDTYSGNACAGSGPCSALGGDCTGDGNCCDGICGASGTCCHAMGFACTDVLQCCGTNLSCEGGKCCKVMGTLCTVGSECCSGSCDHSSCA
jgi:hypothetical protein